MRSYRLLSAQDNQSKRSNLEALLLDDASFLYAAYGADMHIIDFQLRYPGAIAVGPSWLEDYALVFTGKDCHLAVRPEEDKKVPVGVWKVPIQYREKLRKEHRVNIQSKEEVKIFTIMPFIADSKIENICSFFVEDSQPHVSQPDFLDFVDVMEGYEDFGFDKKLLIDEVKCLLFEKRVIQEPGK